MSAGTEGLSRGSWPKTRTCPESEGRPLTLLTATKRPEISEAEVLAGLLGGRTH